MKLLSDEYCSRLRQAREDQDITQSELAERIGCTNVMLCFLESGAKQPSVALLNRWCDALGLELSITVEAR